MVTLSNLSVTGFLLCFFQKSFLVVSTGQQSVPFSPKVPVVCKSKLCTNTPLNLASETALEISGGAFGGKTTHDSEHDSDDELLSFAEESDIIIEVRGGSMTGLQTRPQPLRISTYRKGIRQLRYYERRERRRQKRLERMERRKQRREAKKSHQLYATKLKVSFI